MPADVLDAGVLLRSTLPTSSSAMIDPSVSAAATDLYTGAVRCRTTICVQVYVAAADY